MRGLVPEWQRLLRQRPMVGTRPQSGPALEDAEELVGWLQDVAATVGAAIRTDRRAWERHLNRSSYLLWGNRGSSKGVVPDARRRVRGNLREAFGHLASSCGYGRKYGKEESDRCFYSSLQSSVLNPYDLSCRFYAELTHERLVVPGEYFLTAPDSPWTAFDASQIGPPIPELADRLPALTVKRARCCLEALYEARSRSCTRWSRRVDMELADAASRAARALRTIEPILLHSAQAIRAEPSVVLSKVYFALHPNPDQQLLHERDDGALDQWRRPGHLLSLSPEVAVAAAIEALAGPEPQAQPSGVVGEDGQEGRPSEPDRQPRFVGEVEVWLYLRLGIVRVDRHRLTEPGKDVFRMLRATANDSGEPLTSQELMKQGVANPARVERQFRCWLRDNQIDCFCPVVTIRPSTSGHKTWLFCWRAEAVEEPDESDGIWRFRAQFPDTT